MKETAAVSSWAFNCSQGLVIVCLSLEHNGLDASTCPQAWSLAVPQEVSSFPQESGWALSVVSETKALIYALLTRFITIYLKLKFSNP